MNSVVWQVFVVFFTAAISENLILSRYLGFCPFFGVSNKLSSAFEMGLAVVFVMVFSSLMTWLLQLYVLNPLGLGFLQIVCFILVIAALVQVIEFYIKKQFPVVYEAFGIYLPLITTNCTILGIAILNVQNNKTITMAVLYPLFSGIGYMIALVLMGSIRERIDLSDVPKPFKGTPIALITASLLALAFVGLTTMIIH